uniref:Uncharacterized protein n=1 Tax=Anguilla anguilla TaxID=7936 RepID=A0A0E9WK37_ANGAN
MKKPAVASLAPRVFAIPQQASTCRRVWNWSTQHAQPQYGKTLPFTTSFREKQEKTVLPGPVRKGNMGLASAAITKLLNYPLACSPKI